MKYLEMVGVTDDKIKNTISTIDNFVAGLATKGENVVQQEEKGGRLPS